MLTMARDEESLQEELLWHGTSKTDPAEICMGRDGIDDRLVRWLYSNCTTVTVLQCSKVWHEVPIPLPVSLCRNNRANPNFE